MAVPHARVASCHLSHSYPDGACLYFTFAATPPADEVEATYVALWDAGQRAVLANGGNLSHHHGVGLNRARFIGEALGDALGVLVAVKAALDPRRHPQPRQARLPSPFGAAPWPPPMSDALGLGRHPRRGDGRPRVRRAVLDRRPLGRRQPRRLDARRLAQPRRRGRVRARRRLRGVGAARRTRRSATAWSPRSARTSPPRPCSCVVRLVRGLDVRWFAVVFNLTVVLARRAARRAARPAPAQPRRRAQGAGA